MATEQFANNAQSTLAASMTTGSTTLTVNDASTFPSTPQFRVRIDNELLLVTAISGTTFTVTRGIESTITANHSSGANVTHVLTAAALTTLGGAAATFDVFANRPAASKAGNLFIASDGYELDVDNGSVWTPYGPLFKLTPLVIGNYSWVNQGGATLTQFGSTYSLFAPANSGDNWRLQVKTVPTAPYTVTMMFDPMLTPANFCTVGLVLRDSASGKLVVFGPSTNSGVILTADKITNVTTWSANYASVTLTNLGRPPRFLRIKDDNTNRILSYSNDGINFQQFHSIGRTDWITPNQIGFAVDANNATYPAAATVYSWLETTP